MPRRTVRIIPSICSTVTRDFVLFATGEKHYSLWNLCSKWLHNFTVWPCVGESVRSIAATAM